MIKDLDQEAFAHFVRALAFASDKHINSDERTQTRRHTSIIPIALVSILAVEAGINDHRTPCAALLHDTIEDTETSVEELVEVSAVTVASLVQK